MKRLAHRSGYIFVGWCAALAIGSPAAVGLPIAAVGLVALVFAVLSESRWHHTDDEWENGGESD